MKMYPAATVFNREKPTLLYCGFVDDKHFVRVSVEVEYTNLNRDDPLDRPNKVNAFIDV